MNVHATLRRNSQSRFLMCPPRHFAVTYSINPWMDPRAWAQAEAQCGADGGALNDVAQRQWDGLRRALLAAGAAIEILPAEPGLPDLVFTANAAVVLDSNVVLARFVHDERRREEPVFAKAFRALAARGAIADVAPLPAGVTLEGAGDCIWDRRRELFWMGCGFRSDAAAGRALQERLGVRCLALPLANPKFYHLDTAFCALPCGGVIYYPAAFTPAALALIHGQVAPVDRIGLERPDAANAVCVGRTIILSSCSAALRATLEQRGYAVVETPLDVFQRSGGSACCLTLRLDHQSAGPNATVARPRRAAAGSEKQAS